MLCGMPGDIKIGRQVLAGLLNPALIAEAACREALEHGANYRTYAEPVGLEETMRIYKQRVAQAEASGRTVLGGHDALARLAASGLDRVLIGSVSGDREYTLFFTADAGAVVACLAI
jgi:hypothetical protein